MLFIKSFLRFFILCMNYPRSGLAYFFRIIGHVYGFKYRSERDIAAAKEFKRLGRLTKSNIGHATHQKTLYLDLLSFNLFKLIINEGEELTVEHFFLNRSIKDINYLLNLSQPYLNLGNSSIIFDPACGTGRHLHYVVDTFRCQGIGIDVYDPAIKVANKANIGKSVEFHCGSSLDLNYIDQLLPSHIDLVLINSWLGYVTNEKYFDEFISRIITTSSYIMIISSIKDDIHSIFRNSEFIIERNIENTQYILLKGLREV